jgi:hypothetical protein
MRSSISSSDTTLRHVVILLAGIVALLTVVEIGVRLFVHRFGRIEGRVATEYNAALRVRSNGHPPRQLLLIGNSLLEESVPAAFIRPDWVPGWRVTRFPVEQTSMLDWTYALPRLQKDGCRPDVYGLVMSPHFLAANTFSRGEYSALYLLRLEDVPAISSELHLHPTQIASLVLAIHSKFFALRADIRKVLLGRALPGMIQLVNLMLGPGRRTAKIAPEEYYRLALLRLRAFRAAADRSGSKVVLIVHPPSILNGEDGTPEVLRAAREAGIEGVAVAPGSNFTEADFRDVQHLNETGAAKFIRSIAAGLPVALGRAMR